MPHVFASLPFPKATLAVLESFAAMARIDLDFTELADQAQQIDEKLGALLEHVERTLEQQQADEEEEFQPETAEEDRLGVVNREQIEKLFRDAAKQRAKAFELKQELDRLGVFKDYEDRFLDLFRSPITAAAHRVPAKHHRILDQAAAKLDAGPRLTV